MRFADFFKRKDDKTWLRDFTVRNCKAKSVSELEGLKKWIKLTGKTNGQHLAEYMAPALWHDSLASLRTAFAVVRLAPQEIQKISACQKTVVDLRLAILRATKPPSPFTKKNPH